RLQIEISRSLTGVRAHAARAEAVLRVHGVQLRLVRGRCAKPVQYARGNTLHLAAAADRRRANAGLGPPELPLERPGFQSRLARWLRRRLALLLPRPGVL